MFSVGFAVNSVTQKLSREKQKFGKDIWVREAGRQERNNLFSFVTLFFIFESPKLVLSQHPKRGDFKENRRPYNKQTITKPVLFAFIPCDQSNIDTSFNLFNNFGVSLKGIQLRTICEDFFWLILILTYSIIKNTYCSLHVQRNSAVLNALEEKMTLKLHFKSTLGGFQFISHSLSIRNFPPQKATCFSDKLACKILNL